MCIGGHVMLKHSLTMCSMYERFRFTAIIAILSGEKLLPLQQDLTFQFPGLVIAVRARSQLNLRKCRAASRARRRGRNEAAPTVLQAWRQL